MKEITLEISVVEQMFKTLKKSLSKDKARPILEWIKCEVKGKKLLAVALDGYMLTTFAVDIKEGVEEEFGFYIQPFYIPKYKNEKIKLWLKLNHSHHQINLFTP